MDEILIELQKEFKQKRLVLLRSQVSLKSITDAQGSVRAILHLEEIIKKTQEELSELEINILERELGT